MTSPHRASPDATAAAYMRPMEIVRRYQVSERSVRRWTADGTLDTARVGRSVFVTVDSVRRLFEGGHQ